MGTITVTAKDDLGYSPKFGDIRKGQTYTINEADFAPGLFDAPAGFDLTPYLPQPASTATDEVVDMVGPEQPIDNFAVEEVL